MAVRAPEVSLRGARDAVAGKTVAAIAAALAAFLEEEARSGRAFRIVDVRRYGPQVGAAPAPVTAAWGLAGRLDLMAQRAGMFARRAAR